MADLSDDRASTSARPLDFVNDAFVAIPTFGACLNAHGMYETMRFVLRLSPRNHELLQGIDAHGANSNEASPEVIRAFSTYLHETVHWWQHVGSTSGLLFSLSYLAQVHSSLGELKEVVMQFGAKKPLAAWTDQVLQKEGPSAQTRIASANIAVNNAYDVEFYKLFAYRPREAIQSMLKDNHFESVGHGYFIVYGQLIGMISDLIDPDFTALPHPGDWDQAILRLRSERVDGFYYGSPVRLPAVGLKALFEGQARFIQLQFLCGAQEVPNSIEDWREMGFLSGVYVEAFEAFLKLSESPWPATLSDPIVALFLLICDLAINPTRGMPLDIESFEDFILDVDAGVRFTRLSAAAKDLPHVKTMIKDMSRDEYLLVADELCEATGYDHPMQGLEAVIEWFERTPGLTQLMVEHRTFEYEAANLPIRVFLSHFVSFCQDKIKHPEFFCWPGIYMAGTGNRQAVRQLWLRHLSLFGDRGDEDGVYPRKWPTRSGETVQEMFNQFYASMALYDLTRQWLLMSGPFVMDYSWISEKFDRDRAEAWANETLRQVYGVGIEDFEIVR